MFIEVKNFNPYGVTGTRISVATSESICYHRSAG